VIDHESVPACDGLEIAASLLGEEFDMKVQPGIKISAAALFASCALMFAPVKAATQTPTQTPSQSPTPTIANTDSQEEINEAAAKAAHEAQEEQERAAKAAHEAQEEQEKAAAHAAHEAQEAQERAAKEAAHAAHEAQEDQERAAQAAAKALEHQGVTVVGCVMRGKEYRKQIGSGIGGDYVLVNASRITPDQPEPAAKNCAATAGGTAFKLTGPHQSRLKLYVGRRVEVTGKMEQQDIDVYGVKEYIPTVAEQQTIIIMPRAQAQAPAPAPTVAETPHQEPEQPTATTGRETLPKTATSMPLVALFGALFVAAAIVLKVARGIASL